MSPIIYPPSHSYLLLTSTSLFFPFFPIPLFHSSLTLVPQPLLLYPLPSPFPLLPLYMFFFSFPPLFSSISLFFLSSPFFSQHTLTLFLLTPFFPCLPFSIPFPSHPSLYLFYLSFSSFFFPFLSFPTQYPSFLLILLPLTFPFLSFPFPLTCPARFRSPGREEGRYGFSIRWVCNSRVGWLSEMKGEEQAPEFSSFLFLLFWGGGGRLVHRSVLGRL